MVTDKGSRWIKRSERCAIYDRDGWRCVYCGRKVNSGKGTNGCDPNTATLDHVTSRLLGGSDDASNLVTSCIDCNVAKSSLSVTAFVAKVAKTAEKRDALAVRIRVALKTELDRVRGRKLARWGL